MSFLSRCLKWRPAPSLRRRSRRRHDPVPALESLENRVLLSSISLSKGTLTLNGSGRGDVLRTNYADRGRVVQAQILTNGHLIRSASFRATQVSEIVMRSGRGNDQLLNGTHIRDQQYGGVGNDHLTGGARASQLYGQGGRDLLTGGRGNDSILGGGNVDRVQEVGNVNFAISDVRLTGLGDDSLQSIEQATLIGGQGNNAFYGYQSVGVGLADYFSGTVVFSGLGGNDTLEGTKYGIGVAVQPKDILNGGAGNDSVRGSGTLIGGAGNDSLYGPGILIGGTGNDGLAAYYDTAGSTLIGGAGNDYMQGNSGPDRMLGGTGNDYLSPVLFLGDFDDQTDIINGQAGHDILSYKSYNNLVLTNRRLVGMSTDVLQSIETATLYVGAGPLVFDASLFSGSVRMFGGTGNDHFIGGSGNDVLFGAKGDDVLIGNRGDDILIGGEGADGLVGGGSIGDVVIY